jgi:acyl carrier protein
MIAPQQGLDALEAVLRWGATQIGVIPIDWQEFLRQAPSRRIPPMLFDVAKLAPAGMPAAVGKDSFRERLQRAAAAERPSLILEQVRDQAARVLGLTVASRIDPGQPLKELGLDSLMAVELRNALGVTAGQTLPATLLFDYPTVQALSGYLAQNLFSADLALSEDAERGGEDPDKSIDINTTLEALSEEEMAMLLSDKLEAIESESDPLR